MANRIAFTKNVNDQSTQQGFQFEFYCDRCGSGFRSRFKASTYNTVNNVLDVAGNLFGGLFNTASNISDRVRSAAWEKAYDQAYEEAVAELKPDFIMCPRCSSWVCKQSCWNEKRGLCKKCAPDLGVEMSAAQASRSVEEVWAHACMADEDKPLGKETWKETIRASCPKCNASLEGVVKFCPECGANLAEKTTCPDCNAKLTPGAKFCPECGTKVGG